MIEATEKFSLILREFRKVKPLGPVSQFSLFLEVADNEGQTVSNLAERADMSVPAVSRTLADMGATARDGSPGLNLVESWKSHEDGRVTRVRLTPQGQQMMRSIHQIMIGKRAISRSS